jgi:hypothetical protein
MQKKRVAVAAAAAVAVAAAVVGQEWLNWKLITIDIFIRIIF